MTNKLTIDPVEVRNLRNGTVKTGVFIYDNYTQVYLDLSEIANSDTDLIRTVLESDMDETMAILVDDVVGFDYPIYVGAQRYTLEDVYPDEESEFLKRWR